MKVFGFILLVLITLSACSTSTVQNEENTMENDQEDLSHLTDLQYKVTQEGATEPAFSNEFWDHKEEGIYVSVVSGEALFSSTHKYDSGTGWPAFTKSIADIEREMDTSHGMVRTEIKAEDGSHLGHVFNDGPLEEGGARYCVNSASLKFIPKDQMKEASYENYLYLFEEN